MKFIRNEIYIGIEVIEFHESTLFTSELENPRVVSFQRQYIDLISTRKFKCIDDDKDWELTEFSYKNNFYYTLCPRRKLIEELEKCMFELEPDVKPSAYRVYP